MVKSLLSMIEFASNVPVKKEDMVFEDLALTLYY